MFGLRIHRVTFLILVACVAVFVLPVMSSAQTGETGSAAIKDVDLDIQLHILVASNAPAEGAKLTPAMEAIARELRPVLPFTNYRLGATFLSRVKNGKPLSVKGVGRTLLVTPALESSVNPTFYELSSGMVVLKADASGREVVQLSPFRFGLRIPLILGGNDDKSGGVVYEGVGITTDVTMREGEPVVVGTLDAGRPNETLVLVLVATRAGAH